MNDKSKPESLAATANEYEPLFPSVCEAMEKAYTPYPLPSFGDLSSSDLVGGVANIGSAAPLPDSYYQLIGRLVNSLSGRDFSTLNDIELNQYRSLVVAGKKFGLIVGVEIIHDDERIQEALNAADPLGKEGIYRQHKTEISVRWAVVDKDVSGRFLAAKIHQWDKS